MANPMTGEPDYFYSPKGYPTCVSPEVVSQTLDKYRDKKFPTWNDRREVILLAKRLFKLTRVSQPTFEGWLRLVKQSPYLKGRPTDFIKDTLRFIETGKREISVTNWEELLVDNPPRDDYYVSPLEINFSNPTFVSDIIVLWCVQPEGFSDMICTLEILFGMERSTDLPDMKKTDGFIKPL